MATNSFKVASELWIDARTFPRRSRDNLGLQAAPRQRPVAFALEDPSLDRRQRSLCHIL
jgi:hypothetical protein